MKKPSIGTRIGGSLGALVLLLLRGVAVLLSGFRLGRLMCSVSIPRMEDHRLRTSLTVLGIAVGVALLVAVTTVNQSIMHGVVATVEDISGKADMQVGAGTSGFDESVRDRVAAVAGVAKTALSVQQVTTLQDPRARGERMLILGVNLLDEDESYFREDHSPGLEQIREDTIPFLNGPDHVLLSSSLAARFGYKLRDRIAVASGGGTRELVIWGFLEQKGLGKAFGGAIAVMDYQAMQALFGRDRNIDRIDVAAAEQVPPAQVEKRIKAVLGPGFTVEQPANKGERVGRMLLAVQAALTMASLIALLVAGLLIYNTMAISVVQRKRELGTLRALGARRAELQRLITLEGAMLGITGAALGVGLGMLLSRALLLATSTALSEAYLQLAATDIHWSALVLVGSALTGVVFATLAAAFAATRAGRIKAVEALRTAGLVQVAPPSRGFTRSDLAVIALLLASVMVLRLPVLGGSLPLAFVAVGTTLMAGVLLIPRAVQLLMPLSGLVGWTTLEVRLAQANLPRDLGRTTSTAAALMVGVAMATCFATFVHSFTSTLHAWVEQTMHGDLFVTNAATMTGMSMKEVPMADTLRGDLLALPQVENVRRLTVIETPYQGYPIKLVSTDTELFARYSKLATLEGSVDDAVSGWKRGEITVSENFGRRFGVHRGDRVALSTKQGTHEFKVCAVLVDYTSDIGAVAMDRSTYVNFYGDTRVGTYELHLARGADAEGVRRAINQRYGAHYDLFVLTNKELRRDVSGRVDQVFSLLRALELAALIVALLGIINALLANILDRVWEIGVLRAVGMRRAQVSKMVVFEAMWIGALGALVGMGVGLGLGYILLHHINIAATGWYFPFKISFSSFVELGAMTLIASAAAGFYPARQAGALKITSALEYQ